MMYERYRGDFYSRAGVVWTCSILQEADVPFAEVGQLDFPAFEALVIEWSSKAKEEVLCGSTASLKVISPSDRTYEDLYTIDPGRIRLDVFREGTLFWSGCLDPEFYEEPYESAADYPVQLTFSDFGILDRLGYNLTGMQTLHSIVTNALTRSMINYTGIDQSLISSYLGTITVTLNGLRVRSDNFYDEDGEASSLKDVIEGLFLPLGLRMVQRDGQIWVYDLNGLYTRARQAQINWNGNSQMMGTDKVANNVKITWNTYAQGGKQGPEDCWTQDVDKNLSNINSLTSKSHGNSEYYSYHYSTDLLDWIDATDAGFTLWLCEQGKNVTLNAPGIKFFKIVEQNDGQESEGVAVVWTSYRGQAASANTAEIFWTMRGLQGAGIANQGNDYGAHLDTNLETVLGGTLAACGGKLFTSDKIWIPPVDSADDLLLRVTLPMLLDCRFNPFEDASNLNGLLHQEDWYKQWGDYGNFVYIPVTLKFQPDGLDTVYCWTNRGVVGQDVNSNPVRTLEATYGFWRAYNVEDDETPPDWGYLCYWDKKNEEDGCCGVMGWKNNRPGKNAFTGKVTTLLKECEDGQYVPYPASYNGGKLWLEVRRSGWIISDGSNNLPIGGSTSNPRDLWQKIGIILFKLPQFEIINKQQFDAAINTDDVEYQAEINAAAKESIDLDTICGTHKNGVPTARGAYFSAQTGQQVRQLTRAGRTASAEELLIGTLYSQYARRHTTLSGEADLPDGGLKVYTEQNQGEKRFLMQAEIMDVITDTSEVRIVELRPDEYDKSEN